ncbi:MAG: fused MFS/spermidine synthase [Rhodospirillaceae bacterium]|nr:fused MFS/spermidine synthase [Rhodospirillaceae bacterium]
MTRAQKKRTRRQSSGRGSRRGPNPGSGRGQGPVPATSTSLTSWQVFAGVIACFFLSGLAALLYQTAWLRQFSLVFGTSELAVATVLAAYMGGLAVGSAVAGRYADRVTRPVLVYGLLEAGIALSALAVPLLLLAASALYASILGDQPAPPDAATIGQPVFYLLVAFVVLAIPTGFMGATLPLLTRYAVRTDREVGPRVALLYAINTAGAVVGTVVAAFVLLPALGLNGTVWVGVAVNVLVFVIAAWLARGRRDITGSDEAAAVSTPPGFYSACIQPLISGTATARERLMTVFQQQPAWMLPLMLVSGATAFLYEVLWTRMLTHVMGGSIYAFATMLAAFLTGIALGGGLAGKVAEQRERAAVAFSLTQLAVGVLSVGVYAWMGPLIPDSLTTYTLALFAVAVMLPATIFIGATLPLSVRVLARDESQATTSTARIYAWNTVGAIIGAILAGFFLIPGLGFEGSIRVAVAVNFALALWAAVCVARPKPVPVGLACVGIAAVLVAYNPSRPQAVVSSTGFVLGYLTEPEEIYYGVGRTSTVMLLSEGGYYYVRTNGLPEASIAVRGAPPVQDPEKWLTALAVAARPDIEDMLVVGFGGGVVLEGVPPSVDRIDVVELEPKVIEANRLLEGRRNIDPLADPRFNVIINDGRNALRLTDKTYDAIVSQPSHPWTAGASHLFTREFVVDVKSHLNDGGLFVQWMNSEFVDEGLLRTLAATLIAEFENVRLYHPSAQVLMFLASEAPLDVELQLARTGRPLIDDVMHFSRLGLNGVEDLLTAMAMDEEGLRSFARRADISTDNNNLMATRSRSRADGLLLADLIELFEPYDPLVRDGSWIHTQMGDQIDYGYIARRLVRMGQVPRATGLAEVIPNFSRQFEVYGLLFQANGQAEQAREAFDNALRANPLNMQARYAVAKDYLGLLSRGEAPEDIQAIAEGLAGSAAAVVRGWGFGATASWASLADIDGELAQTRVTDAWYPEVARLRAEWRVNVAEDRERFAFDALRFIERVLILAPDQNLYLLRAMCARILGDDDRLVESSRYIASYVRGNLNSSASQGYTFSVRDLEQMRQNLTAITSQLSGNLNIADPDRVTAILDDTNALLQYIDDYQQAL